MHSYLEFITTPTDDTPGTLLFLHFDAKRYLIGNFAEGAIRATAERNVSLRKASDFLVTGPTRWSNIGGLFAFILTASDNRSALGQQTQGSESKNTIATTELDEPLRIRGAPNLTYSLAAARHFIFAKKKPVSITEHSAAADAESTENVINPTWSDDCVNVWVLSTKPSKDSQPSSAAKLSTNGRKRSFEEYDEDNSKRRKVAQEQAEEVVSRMFGYTGALSGLALKRLSEVTDEQKIYKQDKVTGYLSLYTGPRPGSNLPFEDQDVLVHKPWPASQHSKNLETTPAPETISYIIRNHPQRGRFLPERAKELDVPKGKLWSELTKGQTVQNIHGKDITPDMVLAKGKPGGGFAILDIPKKSYIDDLVNRPEWEQNKVMEGVEAMIWILGPGIMHDERIKSFQQAFSQMKHIISSPDCCPNEVSIDSGARTTFRHHEIDPEVFCRPRSTRNTDIEMSTEQLTNSDNVTIAKPGLGVVLEPHVRLQTNPSVQTIDEQELSVAVKKDVEALLKEQSLRTINDTAYENGDFNHCSDVEVLSLGTGSSHPSPHRNVSGHMLRVPGCGSYIFDCGEGTLGTLRRMYNEDDLVEVLRDLKMIWVSHLHADHHLGLVSLIKAWNHATKVDQVDGEISEEQKSDIQECRLAIITDSTVQNWLREYSRAEDFGYDRVLHLRTRPSRTLGESTETTSPRTELFNVNESSFENVHEETTAHLESLNLKALESTFVKHCRYAQAVSVTFKNSFKVSYSGDCRPNAQFAYLGRSSDLLIHEATFADIEQDQARSKKHSTVGEAIIVANEMKAKACLLTHFSQRYPGMPPFGATNPVNNENDNPTLDDLDVEDVAPLELEQQEEEPIQPSTGHPNEAPYASLPIGIIPLDEAAIARHIAERKIKIIVAFDYMRFKMKDVPRLESKQSLLRALHAKLDSDAPMASRRPKVKALNNIGGGRQKQGEIEEKLTETVENGNSAQGSAKGTSHTNERKSSGKGEEKRNHRKNERRRSIQDRKNNNEAPAKPQTHSGAEEKIEKQVDTAMLM